MGVDHFKLHHSTLLVIVPESFGAGIPSLLLEILKMTVSRQWPSSNGMALETGTSAAIQKCLSV
jgi:hypothetical protein